MQESVSQRRSYLHIKFDSLVEADAKFSEELDKNNERVRELLQQNTEENHATLNEVNNSIMDIIATRQSIFRERGTIVENIMMLSVQAIEVSNQAREILKNFQQPDQQRGLTARRIRRFQLFTADETHVGDQCSICIEDVKVGRRMRRLSCDGRHAFCQDCIEGWFREHNTCPLCRHAF